MTYKKPAFACFALTVLSGQLSLFPHALEGETGAEALSSAGESMKQFAMTLLQVIVGFPHRFVSRMSSIGLEAVGWITLTLVAMTVALLGFRLRRFLSVALGGGFCFALGYALYETAAAVDGTPEWILSNATPLVWILSTLLGVAGGVLFWYLHRFAPCVLVGLTVGGSLLYVTARPGLCLLAGCIACLVSVLALKEVMVYLTAFCGSLWAVHLVIGPRGAFPLASSAVLTNTQWDLFFILGLILGLVCAVAQNLTSHSRKYY